MNIIFLIFFCLKNILIHSCNVRVTTLYLAFVLQQSTTREQADFCLRRNLIYAKYSHGLYGIR